MNSWYTTTATKKEAHALMVQLRAAHLNTRMEEIPRECRIATERRYMVFAYNPKKDYAKFVRICENIEKGIKK